MGDYAEELSKNAAIVQAIGPIDITAGANGTPICMKHWDHCTVSIQTGVWTGGNCAISLTQDSSVTPTGDVIALPFTSYKTNDAAPGSNTLVDTVCASTFNVDTAASTYVIEVDADSLSDALGAATGNPFDCLRVVAGNPQQADFISIEYILTQGRYTGATATIKDATID